MNKHDYKGPPPGVEKPELLPPALADMKFGSSLLDWFDAVTYLVGARELGHQGVDVESARKTLERMILR